MIDMGSTQETGITPPQEAAESTQAPESNPDTLTPEKAATLFFHSFPFGQGRPAAERAIFDILHHLHPAWRLDEESFEKMKEIALRKVRHRLQNSVSSDESSWDTEKTGAKYHRPVVDYKAEFDRQAQEFRDALEGKDVQTLDEAVTVITNNMASRDNYHMIVGRRREGVPESTTAGDKKFSFLVHYALLGNDTGVAEYNQMFRLIRSNALDQARAGSNKIVSVVDKYNETHPRISLNAMMAEQQAA